ncbi:MAG TPA: nuclear transport factor 2 family protein [Gemmatimonadales bacterium]|nr:nuclear transport factor 2 family protein [Gemmatimonadales bacterium]
MTALRLRHLWLAMSLGGMLATPPKPVLAQDSRTAIESQYQALAEAIRRNDVEGILALQAPAFSSRSPNGNVFDFAAMARYTRRLAAAVDSVIHIRNVIRSFEERGDTSVADVCQEFSRLQRLGDGRRHRIDTSVLQRETWVHLADGWKRLNVTNEHGMRWFVDGVRVDPSKPYVAGMPAYVPEPDPPTGCGLR